MYYETVEAFVKAHGGVYAIKKILLANNGISAVKAMRSIRRWAYDVFGNERIIRFVAMATPDDLRANAEYIRMADEFVEVPGGSNVNNYANVSLIVSLAKRYSVDAVFAGWGHASENPALPTSLENEGIVFMGPPAGPMFALGDKIGSTIIAQSAGVPVIPWSGDGLTVDYKKEGGIIPPATYNAANVSTVEECIAAVKRVGLPVMIKASEGGGGKGIRKVLTEAEIENAFKQVQSEVPGSPIFVMRVAFGARHLEVQLVADFYGNAIALNGRDCSVQRRHQKILEEGPPIACPAPVWREMEKAAIRLAKTVDYRNAGTVEYLFREEDNTFFFLELNPRLQVEHPVTEMITGVNIPATQLQVAMRLPLWRIPDIRKFFGKDPAGTEPIDFDNTPAVLPDGHCIAARITAENPHKGFQPTSGRVHELNFRSSRHVWGYFSIDSSGLIHEFADSQLGHVFAWGQTREQARKNLVVALKDMSIRGEIRTTIEYLKDLIEVPAYKDNKFHTAWLDERIAKQDVKSSVLEPVSICIVGAACETHAKSLEKEKLYIASLERGQMPALSLLDQTRKCELIYENTKYNFDVVRAGPNLYGVVSNGLTVAVEVRTLADGGFLVLMGAKSHVAYLKDEIGARRLVVDAQTCLFVDDYDPTVLRAAMGGKVVRFLVGDGDTVKKDQPFCEVEVMKMIMPVLALEEGKITLLKTAGAVMEPGDVLARLELADPSKVRKAEKFTGVLPALGDPWPQLESGANPHHVLANAKERLEHIMIGFQPPKSFRKNALKNLQDTLLNPLLPMLELKEVLARVRRDLATETADALNGSADEYMTKIHALDKAGSLSGDALASAFRLSAEYTQRTLATVQALPSGNKAAIAMKTVLDRHARGSYVFALTLLDGLLELFAEPERIFAELEFSDSAEKDDVMQELRRKFATNPKKVYDVALSHAGCAMKREVAIPLLELIESCVRQEEELMSSSTIREPAVKLLKRVAALRGKDVTEVALEARQLLIELQQPTYKERLNNIVAKLARVQQGEADARDELLLSTEPVLLYLIDCIVGNTNKFEDGIRAAALESYVRRVYHTYKLHDLAVQHQKFGLAASWSFFSEPDSVAQMHSLTERAPQSIPPSPEKPLVEQRVPTHTRTPSVSSQGQSSHYGNTNRPRAGSGWLDEEELVDAGQLMAHAVAPYILRKATLACFESLEKLDADFLALLDTVRGGVAKEVESGSNLIKRADVQVLHIILKKFEGSVDDQIANALAAFLKLHQGQLKDAGVRRITFALPSVSESKVVHTVVAGHGSLFFTFRSRSNWDEDRLVRHIEPSLAFQLDLQRLSNFNIARVPLGKRDLSSSRTVHVYRATPKNGGGGGSRLFVRALVRQTSRIDGVAQADQYPGPERVLVQAIAAIEAIQGGPHGGTGDGARNHIFLNVLGDAQIEPVEVERMARHLGRRYANRLGVARIGQVELKVNARMDVNAPSIPVRVIASNPTGFGLRVDTYVEVPDPMNPGRSMFCTISDSYDGGVAGALAAMGLSAEGGLAPSRTKQQETDELEEMVEAYAASASSHHNVTDAELHGMDSHVPYPISTPLEERRSRALANNTAFVYDLPALFHKATERAWIGYSKEAAANGKRVEIPPSSVMSVFEELILADEFSASEVGKSSSISFPPLLKEGGLAVSSRPAGMNAIAMVAWRAKIRTPQYPEGRFIVLISNDITIDAGSFGTREDNLFLFASQYARKHKLPRLYVAANSGARIGMADEVKRAFNVAWNDESDPSKGFKYLYLDKDRYAQLGPSGRNSVICEREVDAGQERYRIVAIVGEGRDLGVENLRGSGLIAGETSRAYDETFTLTYVAGRSVGIGAYLVRLGQRTIQKGKDAPIILTGYGALNTLVGSPVYSSNLQLGGPGIMYANGVSHQCVRNDLEGVSAMLHWLAYVPDSQLGLVNEIALDPIDRAVAYVPNVNEMATTDPRLMLTGAVNDATNEWIGGLFDKNSFTEYMGGWAKTIITGRAKLGGVSVGVIIPEARTVVSRIPADPAAPDSQERVVTQAGNVWFPDSSYKTACAIRDINREGLPLIFLINIRGFSGGQRDMYDAVLKYGSMIVDALVEFKQPVIVYIPPHAELRGGAWVVVDPTINENVMEMWCDDTARGGVLEAAGAASIKFRNQDQVNVAHRLDKTLQELDARAAETKEEEVLAKLQASIKSRENGLLPVYKQIATEFADAHDRPGRMVAKGVVRGVVSWTRARKFFYGRLRRLKTEFELARKIHVARDAGSFFEARLALKQIFQESGLGMNFNFDSDDDATREWMVSKSGMASVDAYVKQVASQRIASSVEMLGNQDSAALLRGLMSLISRMSDEGRLAEREELISKLRRGVFVLSTAQRSPTHGGGGADEFVAKKV